MAKKISEAPCYRCGKTVVVVPQQGGRGSSALTEYQVECPCGVHEEFLGKETGKRSVAVAEWNAICKARAK